MELFPSPEHSRGFNQWMQMLVVRNSPTGNSQHFPSCPWISHRMVWLGRDPKAPLLCTSPVKPRVTLQTKMVLDVVKALRWKLGGFDWAWNHREVSQTRWPLCDKRHKTKPNFTNQTQILFKQTSEPQVSKYFINQELQRHQGLLWSLPDPTWAVQPHFPYKPTMGKSPLILASKHP